MWTSIEPFMVFSVTYYSELSIAINCIVDVDFHQVKRLMLYIV